MVDDPIVPVDKDAQIAELTAKLAAANAAVEETKLAHASDVEALNGHLDGLSLVELAMRRQAAAGEATGNAAQDTARAEDEARVVEAKAAADLEQARRDEVAAATERQIALSHGADLMTTTPQGVRYASGCI